MRADLANALITFCETLRNDHGFAIGRAQTHDALSATELFATRDRSRFKAALRAVCCGKPDEVPVFDRVFDDFFTCAPGGTPQPKHAQKRRPDDRGAAPQERRSSFQLQDESMAESWQALRARYSPIEGASPPPALSPDGYEKAAMLADRLIKRLQLGRSRRLRPQAHGRRLDLRRTMRASLQTGGDVVTLRRLGYPRRNPRFIVLIDASRSMTAYAPAALQFAHALCRRTRRAGAFVFSTSLREITRDLRRMHANQDCSLERVGDAWGGGTRIGACLRSFVRTFGSRVDESTYVIVVSDGLDVGEIDQLTHAMREIGRRSAAVAWVNPLAVEPGYEPTARGMVAVLPYITSLSAWEGLARA